MKGLSGLPTEADCLQVAKYLNRTKTSWQTTKIRGAFLVNHHRGIPPLERGNQDVFTATQISDAERDQIALTTTWDLFRLIRGMEKWVWSPAHVQDTFYTSGRAGLAPSHWEEVGKVVHFWDELGVFSINVNEPHSLQLGDTLGYALSDRFGEETLTSLQINKCDASEARPGQLAGCKTRLSRRDLRDNTPVYKVRRTND